MLTSCVDIARFLFIRSRWIPPVTVFVGNHCLPRRAIYMEASNEYLSCKSKYRVARRISQGPEDRWDSTGYQITGSCV